MTYDSWAETVTVKAKTAIINIIPLTLLIEPSPFIIATQSRYLIVE